MRLLDQTKCSAFYLQMYGPQPAVPEETSEYRSICDRLRSGDLLPLENETWFPRVAGIGDVEAPRGWPGDVSALLHEQEVDPSGQWMLGKIFTVRKPSGRAAHWAWRCVWNRSDGRLLFSSRISQEASAVLDARWMENGLLVLAGCDKESSDVYPICVLSLPAFQQTACLSFDSGGVPHAPPLAAQQLHPLRPPHHWLVILANGQGDGAFQLLSLARGRPSRRYCLNNPGGDEPRLAISNDGRWLAHPDPVAHDAPNGFALRIVDLDTGKATTHSIDRGTERVRNFEFNAAGRLELRLDSGTITLP